METYELNDNVIDAVEKKLDEMVDELEDMFSQSVAAEVAVTTAILVAEYAQAGGTSRDDFLHLMGAIFDECYEPPSVANNKNKLLN